MIPQNRLSTISLPDDLVIPDPQPTPLISKQLGGVGISDPSQGLAVKVWTCTVVNDDVVLEALGVPPTVVFHRENISEVSLAFDQNMRPFVAFVEAGQAKFYWYDSLIEAFAFTNLPVGSTTPRATLDDHRQDQLNTSDIILTYIQNGNWYFRAQRDRYLVQYLLYPDINALLVAPRIMSVGMNENWRLQFHLRGVFYG